MSYIRNFVVLKDNSGEFSRDFRQSVGRAIIEQRNGKTRILISLQGIKEGEYIGYIFTENNYVSQWLNVSNKGRCDLNWEVSEINAPDVRAVCILTTDNKPVLTGYTSKAFNWQRMLVADVNAAETAESIAEEPEEIQEEASAASEPYVNEESKEDTDLENTKNTLKEIITQFDEGLKELQQISSEDNSPFEDNEFVWKKTDLRELYHTRNLWRYANNPFVICGYRCYHHIMLGKRDNKCALGVPCIYCKGYTLESQLQGFKEFRPLKGQELTEGSLCYCIISI